MSTFEQLDALSSRELHDRAVKRAERHLDLRFLWRLLQTSPAAEAAGGDLAEGQGDVLRVSGQIHDSLSTDDAALDARRPLYIDYLMKHGDG